MHPPILNLNQVELEPLPEALAPTGETAGRYRQRTARVGQQLGAQKLGYRLYVLEPGGGQHPAVTGDLRISGLRQVCGDG